MITRNSGTITTNVYRKPTHPDRYLHFKSHHDKKHKISTAATLLHTAIRLPNTVEGKAIETNNVVEALKSNGHPTTFTADVQRRQKKTKVPLTEPVTQVLRL